MRNAMIVLGVIAVVLFCPHEVRAIEITTSSLPNATLNAPYYFQLEAAGGYPKYVWSTEKGVMPPGLQLYPWGIIEGEAYAFGTFQFEVAVVDSAGAIAKKTFSMSVPLDPSGSKTWFGGRVEDVYSRNAIAGASIKIYGTGYTTSSGPDGYYEFNDAPVGEYLVLIEKSGYVPGTTKANATLAEQGTKSGSIPIASLTPLRDPIVVGPAGGEFHVTDDLGNDYVLYFPPGAVPGPTAIAATPITGHNVYPAPSDANMIASGLNLTPSGIEFQDSITITMPLSFRADPGSRIPVKLFNPQTGGWKADSLYAQVNPDSISAVLSLKRIQCSAAAMPNNLKTYGDFLNWLEEIYKSGTRRVMRPDAGYPKMISSQPGMPLISTVDCCESQTPCHDEWVMNRESTIRIETTISGEIEAGVAGFYKAKLGASVTAGGDMTVAYSSKNSHDCQPGFRCLIVKRVDAETWRDQGTLYALSKSGSNYVWTDIGTYSVEWEVYHNYYKPVNTPTYVALSAFSAAGRNGYIEVGWTTETEIEHAGFNLYRSEGEASDRCVLNRELIVAKGDELLGANYSYKDFDVSGGITYHYWLEAVDLRGDAVLYGPIAASLGTNDDDDRAGKAAPFSLYQNYPNPFNPITEIQYDLPASGHVNLSIFNALGQRIATLVNEHQSAGKKLVKWYGRDDSGEDVSSGIYFYYLRAGRFSEYRKMVLIR